MRAFDYVRAPDIGVALHEAGQAETRFLAGGTTLLDLMKCGVERPARLFAKRFSLVKDDRFQL